MGTLKKYRFRLAWQNYKQGAVIEPTGVVRDWLLSNGYIEPVPVPEAVPVPESPPAVADRAAESPLPAESSAAAPAFVRKRQRNFP